MSNSDLEPLLDLCEVSRQCAISLDRMTQFSNEGVLYTAQEDGIVVYIPEATEEHKRSLKALSEECYWVETRQITSCSFVAGCRAVRSFMCREWSHKIYIHPMKVLILETDESYYSWMRLSPCDTLESMATGTYKEVVYQQLYELPDVFIEP